MHYFLPHIFFNYSVLVYMHMPAHAVVQSTVMMARFAANGLYKVQ